VWTAAVQEPRRGPRAQLSPRGRWIYFNRRQVDEDIWLAELK
jgi:hypothetical protein